MIVLIVLTAFSLLVLILGFLEVKMPFIYVRRDEKNNNKPVHKPFPKNNEKLVKKSVENTLLNAKFLKKEISEDCL